MEGDMSDLLVSSGQEALLHGDFEKAAWALDTTLTLTPSRAPQLWQRGLCCYYTGRYREGMEQFEADMSENGSDIEEVVWHFLCKSRLLGFEEARRTGFLPLRHNALPPPPPMPEVLLLFQSQTSAESVIEAATAKEGEIVRSYNDTNALAYAYFYIGLYYEIQGMVEDAEPHLLRAAELKNPDYMGRLMVMHHKLFLKTAAKTAFIPSLSIGAHNSSSSSSYSISAVIVGGWQLSEGHCLEVKCPSNSDLLSHLLGAVDRGITAFDCGDIYTGVEELFGSLINAHHRHGGRRGDIYIHTKMVPDLDVIRAGKVDQEYVYGVVRCSLNRLGTSYLDLVQLHWWDYASTGYVEAAQALCQLQQEGMVRQIGLTNFDAEHTQELLSAGVPIATTQVQLSLLDHRPTNSGLMELCQQHGVGVLAYGVLAGGFLTDQWLGRPLPVQLANRSLVKYLLIIEEFGGWALFQQLLQALREVADRHPPVAIRGGGGGVGGGGGDGIMVTISMVAIAHVLSLPGVSGIILGSVKPSHLEEAVAASHLKLSDSDCSVIQAVLQKSTGPLGMVYGLERDQFKKHASIMKYNLNQLNQPPHLEELCHRFLRLFFRAYPSKATCSGYRHLSKDDTLLEELCARGRSSLIYDLCSLHAMQACSYDHDLTLSSSFEIDQHCQRVERLLREAAGIDTTLLDLEQNVDLSLIVSQLKLELVKWREVRMHEKDPAFYLHFEAINFLLPVWGDDEQKDESHDQSHDQSCSDAENSSSFPLQELSHPGVASLGVTHRLLALLSRLRAFPQLLTNAQVNLTAPVRIFVERANTLCSSLGKFLKEDFPHLVQKLVSYVDSQGSTFSAPLIEDLVLAAQVAAVCIAQYKEFLEGKLLCKAIHPAAVGKAVYEKLLCYGHFLGSSDELLAIGEQHFAKVKQQLQDAAKGIDPARTWQEITKQVIWPLHSSASTLLPSYMEEIQRARAFMASCDILPPLPEGERVVGFHTPSFLVPFSPFGDFLNPAPFVAMREDPGRKPCKMTGYFMLHSVEAMSLSPEEEEKLLRAHDFTWISVIAPHECYPGHHVQALLSQQHPRVLRKFYESTLFYEGWGLYCENLAFELGFFKRTVTVCSNLGQEEFEQLSRLTQLRLQLWRSVRIILDVKFHREELSFEQCQEFLQREVMFNPQSSAGEVFLYASRPTYVPCYVAGYLNLMQLREETRRKYTEDGREFSLKDFHWLLLSKGCLPFQLLRKLL